MTDNDKHEGLVQRLEGKDLEEMETSDMVIYDVPEEVREKFISLTKLEYDDKGWYLLADAIQALMNQRTTEVENLKEKVNRLEKEINIIKQFTSQSEEQRGDPSKGKPTFGDVQETDVSDELDKLENISQSIGEHNNDKE